MDLRTRPKEITIEREQGQLQITWGDGFTSVFELTWLRANCPCASCRQQRREAAAATDMLMLNSGPMIEPSTEISTAELVGNYAIRLEWSDGHATGIYPFTSLRTSSYHPETNPEGPTALISD